MFTCITLTVSFEMTKRFIYFYNTGLTQLQKYVAIIKVTHHLQCKNIY